MQLIFPINHWNDFGNVKSKKQKKNKHVDLFNRYEK